MSAAPEPVRALLRVLGPRERTAIVVASLVTFLERLAVVGVTFEVIGERAAAATAITAALAVAYFARSALRSYLRVEVNARLISGLAAALLSDEVELGAASVDDTELGLLEGVHACEAFIGEHVPEALGDVPACAFMLVLACATLPERIVAEGGVAVVLGAFVVLVARRVSAASADRVWEAYGPVLDDLSTALRGRVEVIASGNDLGFLSALEQKMQRWRSISARASVTSFLAGRAPALAVALGAGLALLLDEGLRGTLTHGVFGRAVMLASMTPAFAGLARASLETGRARVRMRPVAALIEHSAGMHPRGEEPPKVPTVVDMNHVAFAYRGVGRPVIEDLSAVWQPGQILALTGPNGSGKSTMLALLLGLVQPTRGTISVAGKDLQTIDRRHWRKGIAYLSQRPFLADRSTVAESMRLIADHADPAVLEHSLRQVRLWPVLLARSPEAPFETKVGSLSSGEKQRLALARVLARRAPILILDEPDANLDADGVDLLAVLLRELAPKRLIILAAHTPRLIAAAHRVLALARTELPAAPANPGESDRVLGDVLEAS
jgi:ABC-type multidrug transport system fused ATPase/permease subunit